LIKKEPTKYVDDNVNDIICNQIKSKAKQANYFYRFLCSLRAEEEESDQITGIRFELLARSKKQRLLRKMFLYIFFCFRFIQVFRAVGIETNKQKIYIN
jgi:hypothetical protein